MNWNRSRPIARGRFLHECRAPDVASHMMVASKFVSLRVTDGKSEPILNRWIEPEGKLEPLEWNKLSLPMTEGQNAAIVEGPQWDHRLFIGLDNPGFATADRTKR